MYSKKSLTLLNLLIAIVVLAILTTIASPLYLNAVENAKAKVCATNLKTLKMAVEAYGLENSALPGSLSQLRPKDIKKAWAKVFKEENPFIIKLAYFLVDFDKKGLAYAKNSSFRRFVQGSSKTFMCPDDTNGFPSYGINTNIANMSWKDYEKISDITWVVADCDSAVCSVPVKRHKKYKMFKVDEVYSQAAEKNNQVIKNARRVSEEEESGALTVPGPPASNDDDGGGGCEGENCPLSVSPQSGCHCSFSLKGAKCCWDKLKEKIKQHFADDSHESDSSSQH